MTRGSWAILTIGLVAGVVALFSFAGQSSSSLTTAGLTTLLGVVVFVVGQWILKVYIEPIQEQRKIVGRVEHALRYYDYQPFLEATRSIGMWTGEEPTASEGMSLEFVSEGKVEFRKLAAELVSNMSLVPRYKRLARWGLVKRRDEVEDAAMGLIEMSITFGDPDQEYRETRGSMIRVQSALGITIGQGGD